MERRDIAFREVKLADDGDETGSFTGYGAYFGNVDSYGDVIAKGAFSRTLSEWQERGKWPPMLLQHGSGFFGGTADDMVPIGQWTAMEENSRGLKVDGKLFALETDRAQYIMAGLKSGVLDGLSIGFMTREATNGVKPDEPDRTLTDVELWEVSIVTFPANPKARITNVKAQELLASENLCAFEANLRKEGFARKDCERAVWALKNWLRREAGDVPGDTPSKLVVPDDEREAEELLKAFAAHTDSFWSEVFRK